MLRKIVIACVAAASVVVLAVPAEAARKKVADPTGRHDPALRTFHRGENWYFRGNSWTGVGLYPFGMFSDEGCWKNRYVGGRWRGVWVCR
ncbi:MAG: hypothetical protein NTV56_06275 [Alphaproteobacteria bacterium]|nr:hypothetical protein [Alphaproteobacteria bacterium]